MRLHRFPLTLLLAVALATGTARAAAPGDARSPDGLPQRLVLALDGIPFDLFVQMQQAGHFTGFHPAARMVAPFPSL